MIRNMLIFVIVCAMFGCANNSKQVKPAVVYEKEDGVIQFVQDVLPEYGRQKFNLVIANNRSCNCGGSTFDQIDSLKNTAADLSTVWVLTEPDSSIENTLALRGDQHMYLDGTNLRRYGISTISPQVFTIDKNKVIDYKRLPH